MLCSAEEWIASGKDALKRTATTLKVTPFATPSNGLLASQETARFKLLGSDDSSLCPVLKKSWLTTTEQGQMQSCLLFR